MHYGGRERNESPPFIYFACERLTYTYTHTLWAVMGSWLCAREGNCAKNWSQGFSGGSWLTVSLSRSRSIFNCSGFVFPCSVHNALSLSPFFSFELCLSSCSQDCTHAGVALHVVRAEANVMRPAAAAAATLLQAAWI